MLNIPLPIHNFPLFTATQLKQSGIKVAVDHANLKHDGWGDDAYDALKRFLTTHKNSFMCEEVRKFAHLELGLPQPSSSRAWGAIFQKAARQKIIKHVGYGHTENPKSHCTPASLWIAAQWQHHSQRTQQRRSFRI